MLSSTLSGAAWMSREYDSNVDFFRREWWPKIRRTSSEAPNFDNIESVVAFSPCPVKPVGSKPCICFNIVHSHFLTSLLETGLADHPPETSGAGKNGSPPFLVSKSKPTRFAICKNVLPQHFSPRPLIGATRDMLRPRAFVVDRDLCDKLCTSRYPMSPPLWGLTSAMHCLIAAISPTRARL